MIFIGVWAFLDSITYFRSAHSMTGVKWTGAFFQAHPPFLAYFIYGINYEII